MVSSSPRAFYQVMAMSCTVPGSRGTVVRPCHHMLMGVFAASCQCESDIATAPSVMDLRPLKSSFAIVQEDSLTSAIPACQIIAIHAILTRMPSAMGSLEKCI
ncbi:hypothetical protein PYCCODRAFT_815610 [Trametes coccinea BRFM310]|uniref:Uncharacterized protein n=1 Tax=Trametes coccinea (strain BRFM310) TaxID=1353009 RepID=A0A1Y2IEQ5_TRAC3|nr:hypothetical protein PYCCODRAFT_815610 [Trametes coccinea BRFM310]